MNKLNFKKRGKFIAPYLNFSKAMIVYETNT